MQWSVLVEVEVDERAGIVGWERAIQEAGRDAMRRALAQAVHAYEERHPACVHCGREQSRSEGTVRRVVRTCFGRVVLALRRQHCLSCGRRFRPSQGCLQGLGRGQITPDLAAACALAGASWPFATAARVLHRLSGAAISAEAVRRLSVQAGRQEAAGQQAEAVRLLQPTAQDVRAERDAAEQARRTTDAVSAPAPARLVVGLDGGWVPSREPRGGMEGKVGVVATGAEPVGRQGRQRLTPRRYVATFADSEQVGQLAYAAAVALGGQEAHEQVVLGGGAGWIKTQADLHFPEAVGILDWAHVERALHHAMRAARPGPTHRARRRELHQHLPDLLWHGDLEATLAALLALRPPPPADPLPALDDTIGYLRGQRAWLGDYAAWQAAGYPVGSGLIERAVALVITWRMERRGMRGLRLNASAVVALRVRELNADWDSHHALSPPAT
jgi:hypothetical protein